LINAHAAWPSGTDWSVWVVKSNPAVAGLPDGFKPKIQFWSILEGLIMESVDIFYVHLIYFMEMLVYFMAIWYILWLVRTFSPFWYVAPRKIWQACAGV
jgi:hypothetical protein